MSKILIIGNSLAAISAVEEVRRQDSSVEMTLFCPEGVLPYNRYFLSALVARDVRESHLFPKHEKFFHEHNVQLVLNESLARISTKRRQVTTENKTHLPYDKLLLTDLSAVKLPQVKGHHKKGIFDALRLTAARDLIKHLPFADNMAVSVTNFAGFDMACALSRLGKEIVVLSPPGGLLGEIFDDETASLLKQIIEGRGMRVITDEIEEILGDAEVKAVRLNSGKVMAAEAVIFDEVSADLKILSEAGLLEQKDPDVFICDAVLGGFDLSPEELIEQGRCAAANMLNAGAMTYQPPLVLRDFGHRVCDGFCGGVLRLQESGREHMKFDGPSNIYKKIFLLNDRLVGAVWFNALSDKDKVRQALAQKLSLAGAEEQFL